MAPYYEELVFLDLGNDEKIQENLSNSVIHPFPGVFVYVPKRGSLNWHSHCEKQ